MSIFYYLLILGTFCATVKSSHTQMPGDIVHIEVCERQTANFTMAVSRPEAEVNRLRLTFQGKSNHSATIPVASVIYGRLLPDTGYATRVRRLPNDRGIRLLSARKQDEGVYSLSGDIRLNGSLSLSTSLTIYLKVKDLVQPQIREEEVWWNAESEQWLLPLSCNILTAHLSQLPLHTAQWTNPDDEVLNSTRYGEGKFYLDLPLPVTGGQYLCRTPPRTDADVCLGHHLHGQTKHLAVGVRVDEVSAHLKMLEAQQQHLKADDNQLDEDIFALNVTLDDLGIKQVAQNANYNTLITKLTKTEANLTALQQRDISLTEALEELSADLAFNVTQIINNSRNVHLSLEAKIARLDQTILNTAAVTNGKFELLQQNQSVLWTNDMQLRQDLTELIKTATSQQRMVTDLQELASLLKSELALLSPLRSELALLKKENQELGNRLSLLQDLQKTDDRKTKELETELVKLAVKSNRTVGFQVDFGKLPYKYVTLSKDRPTRFDRVLFNEGQGYDESNGVFTAPYSGLYTFTFDFNGGNHNDSTGVQIYSDSKNMILAVASAYGYYEYRGGKDSCTAVTRLVRGHQVSVRLYYGNPSIWGSLLTSFSGLLIHADE